jgi:tetratricopeptide (TPR) repeat protein
MKTALQLPLAAGVALLVGALSALVGPAGRGAEVRGGTNGEASELRRALDELRSEQQALAQRVASLPTAPSAAPTTRAPAQDLDAAIAAYMAQQINGDASDFSVGDSPADLESAALAERILSGQVKGDELDALWQKLREEKRIDAVLAEIEHQAELAPNNPDLQNELGQAYLQKLFDVGMGPMAGVWGERADKAFDRALELDETHWDARFNKALSLSNAPAFLGLQTESRKQFEILMEQQERGAASPEQVSTYYFLGNLYDQGGEHEKALEVWKRGSQRFPDSESLRTKLEVR